MAGRITRKAGPKNDNKVRQIYKCRECKRQFSATVGTIFKDSKVPLRPRFAAIWLICSSKKGFSAHQISRMLDVQYRTAWFMKHRTREAMTDKTPRILEGIVEPMSPTSAVNHAAHAGSCQKTEPRLMVS